MTHRITLVFEDGYWQRLEAVAKSMNEGHGYERYNVRDILLKCISTGMVEAEASQPVVIDDKPKPKFFGCSTIASKTTRKIMGHKYDVKMVIIPHKFLTYQAENEHPWVKGDRLIFIPLDTLIQSKPGDVILRKWSSMPHNSDVESMGHNENVESMKEAAP
jgi:hypothetical protein